MKIKRIFSLLLSLVLAVSLLPAYAFAAGSITVNSVAFEPYEDAYGGRNDELVTVVISFTAPAGMAEISVLLAGADIKTMTEENKHHVIHQTQTETPANGLFSFAVAKDRIASATGQDVPDGAKLNLRMSGTGASTASTTVTYKEPTPAFGDLNGDGKVSTTDAVMILRYVAGLAALTTYQLDAADVIPNGTVDIGDAVRILRFEAKLDDTLVGDPS